MLLESSQEGSNGCLPQASVQPSPIEFTAGPATETPLDGESEDDDDDDEDEEDVVAEAGQGSDADAVVVEQPCIKDVATEDGLLPQNVGWFDGRHKFTGFIDVWWLFDDGGMELNFVLNSCGLYLWN